MTITLFETLQKKLRSGLINQLMSKSFAVCSILYSIIENEEAAKKEKICQKAAV
jgi:hypothetical protein